MDKNFIADVLAYDGDPIPAYEMLSERERRFFAAIASDDALIAVLRGHLFVEADVTCLLAQLFPGAEALIDDLSYEQKIRRLKKAVTLPVGISTSLKALGELRNAFAHNLERDLTEADDARFFGALGEEYKPEVQELIAHGAFPEGPGARVRASIIVLHTGLSALRLALHPERDKT